MIYDPLSRAEQREVSVSPKLEGRRAQENGDLLFNTPSEKNHLSPYFLYTIKCGSLWGFFSKPSHLAHLLKE